MKIFIISFISGGIAGYILTKANVNIYIILIICFFMGAFIGWLEIKWKHQKKDTEKI